MSDALPPLPPDEQPEASPRARVELSFELPPGAVVRVQITARGETPLVEVQTALPQPAPNKARHIPQLLQWLRSHIHPQPWALGLALLLYALTRLIALPDFPSYFSCDEAISGAWARSLLQDGLRDSTTTELLPTFMKNDGQYSLSATVYLLLLPVRLFGTSVWLVRGITALLSLLMAWWLVCIGRDFLHLRLPWLSVLLLACIPTWLLHSRTGLEAPQMVAFYTGFVYYYLRYREGKGRALWVALLLGVLVFYTYTPGQLIMVFSGLLLLGLDARYHWQQRRFAAVGLGILILAALPLLRFWILHPTAYSDRLVMYGSYLAQGDLTLWQKLLRYLSQYAAGLDPAFWFLPNPPEHIKYKMGPYPNIPWLLAPLLALGLWLSLRRWREPVMRLLWVALIAAPSGAALVNAPSVPRLLLLVLPAVLFSAIGLQAALDWLATRRLPKALQSLRWLTSLAAFCILGLSSLMLLQDALRTGPLWYRSYGIDGLQWGAPQVFGRAVRYAQNHPDRLVAISPTWTFQGDRLLRFFATDSPTLRIEAIEPYFYTPMPDSLASTSFWLSAEDFRLVNESGRFAPPVIEDQIPYPDGSPGFYLVQLRYADNLEQLLQDEKNERHRLVPATWQIEGLPVTGQTSQLDGSVQFIFDGNPESVTRTQGANPLVLEWSFSSAQELRGLQLRAGSEAVRVTAIVTATDPQQNTQLIVTQGQSDGFKDVVLDFEQSIAVQSLRLELFDLYSGDPALVHLWEITLLR